MFASVLIPSSEYMKDGLPYIVGRGQRALSLGLTHGARGYAFRAKPFQIAAQSPLSAQPQGSYISQ
jgi:hypothetical protein